MSPLDADVAFMTKRIADLLAAQTGLVPKLNPNKNQIVIERPGAADNGVIIIELRGSRG